MIKQSKLSSLIIDENINEYVLKLTELMVQLHKDHQYVGIMHPQNIKYTNNKFLYQREQLTEEEEGYYLAPEQFHMFKNNKTEQSDLYSLGVLIYTMYAKTYPIVLRENQSWLEAHLSNEVRPIEQLNSRLNKILLKLLDKNPQKRYYSSLGLLYELRVVFGNEANDDRDQLFKIGEIDDRLQAIENITYPIHPSTYTAFNTFLESIQPSSYILTLEGQTQEIRKQVLSQLSRLIDHRAHHVINIGSYQSNNAVIDDLVKQYLTLIATYSSAQLKVILENILSVYEYNLDELIYVVPKLSLLFNKAGLNYANQAGGIRQDKNLDPKLIVPLLKVIHQYIPAIVYWIVNGEEALTYDELSQIVFLRNEFNYSVKLVISHTINTMDNVEHSVTKIILDPLKYEQVRLLLSQIMMEDSAQLRILAQSLLYISQGNLHKLKLQLLQWQKESLIYFDDNRYHFSWNHQLIENQPFTEQLIKQIKDKIDQLDQEVHKILAVSALIDTRVNALLLAEVYETNVLTIHEAMDQADQLGIVFYNKKDLHKPTELSEYVFLNDELRLYLQQFIENEKEKWHYKIGIVLHDKHKNLHANSESLSLKHFNLSHRLLSESGLEQLIYKNFEYGIEHFYKTSQFKRARYYFQAGKELCEQYGDKYKSFYYRFILYLATTEYLCHNETLAKQLFAELEPHVSLMEINDQRNYYIWQMEIYAFEDGALCLEYGTLALDLFDLKIPSKVRVTSLIKEVIVTQRLLKNYRLGKLHIKTNNSLEFRLLCRTVYGISSAVSNSNPMGLIYFYTKFLQNNLLEGENDELALLVSMYELMIQRGAAFIYKLMPSEVFEFILSQEKYNSSHFYIVKAILTQMEKPQDVYPFLSLAISKAVEDNDYRSVNFALLANIVMFDENIKEIETILNFIRTDINISLDVNLQELVDEFISYYEANQSQEYLIDYININYDVTKRHINYISMNRMEMSYIARHYERVLYWEGLASQTMVDVNWAQNRKILLYKHLAIAALYYKTDDKKVQKEYTKQLNQFIRKMKNWEGNLGKDSSVYHLVCAEYQAILNNAVNAQTLYENAIKSARKEKNSRIEAIALECLAHFYTRLGSETGKMITLMDAITAYSSYGIKSKVDMLSSEVKLPLTAHEEEKTEAIQHQTKELAVTESIDMVLAKSERKLSEIYTVQGHWNNQTFINSFLSLACRQVTASFGFLLKYEKEIENSTLLSEYGNFQLINNNSELKPIFNYCANTQNTFVYNMYTHHHWNMNLNGIQSLICVPIKLINREDTYILGVGSECFNHLFNDQEKLILELLLSRFIYLAEDSQVTSKQVTTYLNTSVQSSVLTTLLEPLTERELDVLREIVNGLSNDEISKQLDIKLATVKTHINNVYSKLGVKRRAQAIIKANEMNLV